MNNASTAVIELLRYDDYYSIWDLSIFLKQVADAYYKADLISLLGKMLDSEDNINKIFILDGLSINTDIEKYNFIEKPYNLFKLSSIVPLSSNYTTDSINDLYKIYKNTKKTPNLNKSYIRALKAIIENKDVKIQKHTIEGFITYCKEKQLLKNNLIDEKSARENYIINSLHDSNSNFFRTLKKLKRPLIGILGNQLEDTRILAVEHLDNYKYSPRKIVFKSIEHNSPWRFSFQALAETGLSLYSGAMREIRENEIYQLEKQNLIYEIETRKNKLIESDYRARIAQLEYIKCIDKMKDSNIEPYPIPSLTHNPHFSKKVTDTYKSNISILSDQIYKNRFSVINYKIDDK